MMDGFGRMWQNMMAFHAVSSGSEATSLSSCIALPKLSPVNSKPPNSSSNNDNESEESAVLLPWVGYGTYRLGRNAQSAVHAALQIGYRHIDTAFVYGGQTTEIQVGNALRDSFRQKICDRQDVFITTKQWREYHGYDESLKCLEMSLERLGLDYVDMWMMHWPGPCWESKARQSKEGDGDKRIEEENDTWSRAKPGMQRDEIASIRAETWRAMEDAYRSGKARSIAVSNLTIQHLQTLKQTATLWPPAANQIELHPYYPQRELVEYCKREGIVVQAYASLGGQDGTKAKWKKLGGKLLESPPVIEASNNLSSVRRPITPGQVLLRWALQSDVAIIPKTICPVRMRENSELFDFELSNDVMDAISNLGDNVQNP